MSTSPRLHYCRYYRRLGNSPVEDPLLCRNLPFFHGGYAVFLAPIAGIMASDFWLVKSQNLDVPALYNPDGRYRYRFGINWRAMVAFLFAVTPNLPGLAYSINNNASISDGAKNFYSFDWLYGFVCSIFLYTSLSKIFPAQETLVQTTIYGTELDDSSQLDEKGYPSGQTLEKDFGNGDTSQGVDFQQKF
jgi:nucleobase:cation symporter-1, NCS1 family